MDWIDIIGWSASALLLLSLLQQKMLRLRILNLVGSAALVFYNAMLSVWPMTAMNFIMGIVNICFIIKIARERRKTSARLARD